MSEINTGAHVYLCGPKRASVEERERFPAPRWAETTRTLTPSRNADVQLRYTDLWRKTVPDYALQPAIDAICVCVCYVLWVSPDRISSFSRGIILEMKALGCRRAREPKHSTTAELRHRDISSGEALKE